MSALRRLIILLSTVVVTSSLVGQEGPPNRDQLRINELVRESAKLKQQLKEKNDEIERIMRSNPNAHLVVPAEVSSSPSPTPPVVQVVLDKLGGVLKLRQTLQDPTLAELPAKITYVHPEKGNDTIAIDAGLDLNVLKAFDFPNAIRETNLLDIFTEYHKSSSANAPVDTVLAGAQFQHNLGEFGDWGNWLGSDASFKRDNIVSGEGLLANLFYYPSNLKFGINSFKTVTVGPWQFEYLVNPTIGLQYETGNGASSKFPSGERVSFKGAFNVTVTPFVNSPYLKGLQWSNTVIFLSHLGTSGVFDQYDRNQYLFQSSLNFYLDPAKQVALGLDYTYGDNLTTNQFDINMWTFSFKAKLGK
jgi:hypothetical protein